MSPAWHIPEGIWSQCLLSKSFYSLTVRLSADSIWKLMSLVGLSLLDNSGQLFAVNLLLLWFIPHSQFDDILSLRLCFVMCLTVLLNPKPQLLFIFRSLLYMRKNSVVLFPWRRPRVTGKVKVCSLYCMQAVKPLCEALSRAELVSCKKHLMSVCGIFSLVVSKLLKTTEHKPGVFADNKHQFTGLSLSPFFLKGRYGRECSLNK